MSKKMVFPKSLLLCLALLRLTGAEEPVLRDELPESKSSNDLLERVFLTIEKLAEFFASDYSQVNVDGLFGLRLGQGQLISAIKDLEGTGADLNLIDRVEALEEKVDYTCSQIIPYVEARDPEYFDRFRPTVEDPYILPYDPHMLIIQSAEREITDFSPYDEEAGDVCLSKIMGTFEHGGSPVPQCTSDEDCFNMMTSPGTSGYTITHQLLYFILLDKMQCREELQTVAGSKVNISAIEARMCTEIYKDGLSLIEDGDVPDSSQDLFMEQISLCGVLGYQNFMRTDWIQLVLRWPNAEGCFTLDMDEREKKMAKDLRGVMKRLTEKVDRERREAIELGSQPSAPGGRKLLREFPMRDGCMAHKSGLGFSSLAIFLRHLLRYSVQQNYM